MKSKYYGTLRRKITGSSPASQESFNYGEDGRRATPRHANDTAAEFDELSNKENEEKKHKNPHSHSISNKEYDSDDTKDGK